MVKLLYFVYLSSLRFSFPNSWFQIVTSNITFGQIIAVLCISSSLPAFYFPNSCRHHFWQEVNLCQNNCFPLHYLLNMKNMNKSFICKQVYIRHNHCFPAAIPPKHKEQLEKVFKYEHICSMFIYIITSISRCTTSST